MIDWVPMLLKGRTASSGEAEEPAPAPAAGDAAKETKPATEGKTESLGLLRGLDLPRDLEKPVLVFFHWPHEDGDRGKRIVKFCSGTLDEKEFIRTAPLFYCVEVNTRDSSERFVEEAKVRATPTVMICRPDGNILWRSEDASLSGEALAAACRRVLQDRFPERWADVEKEMKAQKEGLVEARRLLAAKKTQDAMMALANVVGSEVRFTDEWEDARKLLAETEKKIAAEEKEAGRK